MTRFYKFAVAALVVTVGSVGTGHAQEQYAFTERFVPGYQYHVSNRVHVSGTLTLPHEKNRDKVPQITITGKSAIDYDERILSTTGVSVDRTIRFYDQLSFARKVGDHEQANALRETVRRLVLLRKDQVEVAFSPDGPLTWGELDLIRTDVFTPALRGLFPIGKTAVGQSWNATKNAVRELTDLDKIDDGDLICRFKNVFVLAGRKHARVDLAGVVSGLGDDGRSRHQLSGYLYFDLDRGQLSYLYVNGRQIMYDADKKIIGNIQGTFVLTRYQKTASVHLTDDELRSLKLEPNATNTLLLFESAQLGIRFLHPRRWRISNHGNARQLVVEEPNGNGFLVTVEPPRQSPDTARFYKEVRGWLADKKAKILQETPPRYFAKGIDQFNFTAAMDGKNTKLDYYALRQNDGGATVSARYVAVDWRPLQLEVQQVVESIKILRPAAE